jgi:hypothetical protein
MYAVYGVYAHSTMHIMNAPSARRRSIDAFRSAIV